MSQQLPRFIVVFILWFTTRIKFFLFFIKVGGRDNDNLWPNLLTTTSGVITFLACFALLRWQSEINWWRHEVDVYVFGGLLNLCYKLQCWMVFGNEHCTAVAHSNTDNNFLIHWLIVSDELSQVDTGEPILWRQTQQTLKTFLGWVLE